jgi:hypothetical protein
VAECDTVLRELQEKLELSKDEVKQAILTIVFGGKEKYKQPFLIGLREEMEKLRGCAWKEYGTLHALALTKHAEKVKTGKPSAGPSACLLAIVLQTEECRILTALVEAACRDDCSFDTLIHDGAFLRQEDCPDLAYLRGTLLPRWEQAIKDKTGYAMSLAVKPMMQVSVPAKQEDAQEVNQCALAQSLLQDALKQSKWYKEVVVEAVRPVPRAFLCNVQGAAHCGTAKGKHEQGGVYFRVTHFAVYQECSDKACPRHRHVVAKLTPEQSKALFPHAKLDALTEALDTTVRVRKCNATTMKAYSRACSRYLAAAQRYGELKCAREHVMKRLVCYGVDIDVFRATFQACEPAALWAEVYRAAPMRVSKLLADLDGEDSAVEAVRRLTACNAPTGCAVVKVNKPYLDQSDLHNVEVLMIKSAMGTGKSTEVLVPAMRRCLKKNESVLLISPRRSFTASIGNDLVRAGLKVGVYLEARPDMLAPGQVSIISPQSLYKLGADELL